VNDVASSGRPFGVRRLDAAFFFLSERASRGRFGRVEVEKRKAKKESGVEPPHSKGPAAPLSLVSP
jgi:hypothetical protein